MLQIVKSIYKMTGEMVKLPQDEDTPEKVGFFLLLEPDRHSEFVSARG
jgi:7-keto-8-aminopelargonate synthetase-like enzyme